MFDKALEKLTYGLFVLTANRNGFDNGCIINTAGMVADNPQKIYISVNKANLTHDMIIETGKFAVSVLSEKAGFEIFKHFGFVSGKDANKFKDFSETIRTSNGTLAVNKQVNSYICGTVTEAVDLGSHTLFIADITDMKVLNSEPSATYAYYHSNIKPKAAKNDQGVVWRCKICGYEFKGEDLPEDFICPLCKHPASDFEKI